MSLADLKKKKAKKTRDPVNVDDFIDDANAYSKGRSILNRSKSVLPNQSGHQPQVKFKRFKNATFSLSQASIVQLSQLAKETGISKSKLIRILIANADPVALKNLKLEIEKEAD